MLDITHSWEQAFQDVTFPAAACAGGHLSTSVTASRESSAQLPSAALGWWPSLPVITSWATPSARPDQRVL